MKYIYSTRTWSVLTWTIIYSVHKHIYILLLKKIMYAFKRYEGNTNNQLADFDTTRTRLKMIEKITTVVKLHVNPPCR